MAFYWSRIAILHDYTPRVRLTTYGNCMSARSNPCIHSITHEKALVMQFNQQRMSYIHSALRRSRDTKY